MIVHCPSCSTGYHLAATPAATVLRCSRCQVAFPCPAHRRSYVMGRAPAVAAPAVTAPALTAPALTAPTSPPMEGPASLRFLEPLGAPVAGMPAMPPAPAMQALDDQLFSPQPTAAQLPRSAPPSVRVRREVGPAASAPPSGFLPLTLAALGAGAAWFAAPVLTDPGRGVGWIASLPFPVEPWMLGAAGATSGLLLGLAWLGWRAARR